MKTQLLNNQRGFTLVELVVVIVIVGILSYVAATNLGDSNTKLQYKTVVSKIMSDVRYARDLAMTEGKNSRVYIDLSNNRYYLKWDGGDYIQNPVGGGNFVIQLGDGEFSQVTITASAFSASWLEFDTAGSPSKGGVDFTGELSLITLNSAKNIKITTNTGFLRID